MARRHGKFVARHYSVDQTQPNETNQRSNSEDP